MDDKAFAYLKTKVLGATKEELLLIMIDSTIAFATQSKDRMKGNDVEGTHNLLVKSQRLLIELMSGMSKEHMPEEVYNNLMGLYNFVYFRFVWGNIKRDPKLVDEGLSILKHLRETWAMAIDNNKKQGGAAEPPQAGKQAEDTKSRALNING